jgi:hypothetical protein
MKLSSGQGLFGAAVVAVALGLGVVAGCSNASPAKTQAAPPSNVPPIASPNALESDPATMDVGVTQDEASEETEIPKRRAGKPGGRQR